MKYSLNQLLEKYTEKNVDNLYEPVAVGKYGIRKRSEIFKKELADDYSKNKVIYKDTMTIGLGSKQIDFGILKEDMVYSVSPAYFTFKINTEVIKSDYLELLLSYNNSIYTSKYMIASARQGKKVDVENLLKEMIEVPDYNVQEEVVNNISLINQAIKKDNTILALYDELIKARFVEMFGDINVNDKGWDIQPLGELCTIVRGGSPRPIEKFLGGTVPWIKIGDATDDESIYLHSTKEHIIQEGIKKSRLVKEGSLIFANCGVSLGFARIITFDGCIHDGWLAMEDIDERLNKVFLLQALNQMTDHFRIIAPAGTQPNLNTSIMKAYKQILPPMTLQNDYIAFVEKINKSKVAIEKRIKLSEELLETKMSEYFMN